MKLDLPNVTLVCVEDRGEELVLTASEIISGIKDHINFYDVKLLSSTSLKGVTHKISPINNLKDYNIFILNELINYVDSEFVMMIQTDGYPIAPQNWSPLFLNYDYIGAPWSRTLNKNEASVPITPTAEQLLLRAGRSVGNGGFSLRSKRLLKEVASRNYQCTPLDWDEFDVKGFEFNEDEYVCRYLNKDLISKGFTFAPVEVAEAFSIENDLWVGQFGFHGHDTIKLNKRFGGFKFNRHVYEL
mgnify:CR=1 FL=1|jgi:hypothetical protein|tara:strand:- start:714 stop:1445 length:732 start_codon:yes stop_codon:yes gene_type:complete